MRIPTGVAALIDAARACRWRALQLTSRGLDLEYYRLSFEESAAVGKSSRVRSDRIARTKRTMTQVRFIGKPTGYLFRYSEEGY